jgi:hypothetical protein
VGSLLFDGSGQRWDSESPALRERIGGHFAGPDFIEFVLKNLGFVELRGLRSEAIEVRLRPTSASPGALSQIAAVFSEEGYRRFVLTLYDGQWRPVLCRSHQHLLDTAYQAITVAQDRLAKRRHRYRLKLDDIGSDHALRQLVNRWSEIGRRWSREQLDSVIRSALDDRYVLAEPMANRATLTISDVGMGYDLFRGSWLARCRGLTFNDMPDYEYGLWVAEAHRDADAGDDMLLEEVDVVIRWTRQDPRRHIYQRVILPCGTGSERRLLSASVLASALPFDIKAVDER